MPVPSDTGKTAAPRLGWIIKAVIGVVALVFAAAAVLLSLWDPKARSKRVEVGSEAMFTAVAESASLVDSGRYTRTPTARLAPDVRRHVESDDTSWSAVLSHVALPGYVCAIAVRRPNPIAPDSASGQLVCEKRSPSSRTRGQMPE